MLIILITEILYCIVFLLKLLSFFAHSILSAKSGQPLIPIGGGDVREPAYLCHALGARVDGLIVGFTEVIRAAHYAVVLCAVVHREHVAGLMGGNLDCSAEKGIEIGAPAIEPV